MNKVITSVSEMYIDDDGILVITILPGVKIDREKAVEFYEASAALLNGRKALVLLDASEEYELTEEAKALGSSKEVVESRIAIAYVTSSLSNRLMYNLYRTVYKPAVPSKMFASCESGLKWLRSFYVMPGDKFERKRKK